MIEMDLLQAARISGARLQGESCPFRGISMDSRKLEQGMLFLALAGQRTHGIRHWPEARQAGAVALLSDRQAENASAQLIHPRPLKALARLAAHWRQHLPVRVVGVTGSNGKTTVKNLLRALLAGEGATYATEGNYNNELGLPLSVCKLDPSHQWAVLEMGAGKPGDIRELAEVALPEVAVITNATAAHLQGMGSLQAVVETKGEMLDVLPADGVAVLNADDPACSQWRERAGSRRVVHFGSVATAEVQVLPAEKAGEIRLSVLGREYVGAFQLLGQHNQLNAAAAVAACVGLQLDLPAILPRLATVMPEPGRLQLHQRQDGLRVIDDSYNANPASCMGATNVLMEQPARGKRVLVLGDMAELGPESRSLHERLGQYAQRHGVDALWAVGEHAVALRTGFGEGPGDGFADKDTLVAALLSALGPDDVVLVKGSRSTGMESVVRDLLEGGAC